MKEMADIEMLRKYFFEWEYNKLMVQIMKKRENKKQGNVFKMKGCMNDTKRYKK